VLRSAAQRQLQRRVLQEALLLYGLYDFARVAGTLGTPDFDVRITKETLSKGGLDELLDRHTPMVRDTFVKHAVGACAGDEPTSMVGDGHMKCYRGCCCYCWWAAEGQSVYICRPSVCRSLRPEYTPCSPHTPLLAPSCRSVLMLLLAHATPCSCHSTPPATVTTAAHAHVHRSTHTATQCVRLGRSLIPRSAWESVAVIPAIISRMRAACMHDGRKRI
jgi:hypothetical protein